jgi:predicted nuclease of predicted toxin-antitoxin system
MRWLIDNNVPRGVTRLLDDRGHAVEEVRSVLGEAAADRDIAAYASARRMIIVTHDRGLARRCRQSRLAHVQLRTREVDDRPRLDAVIEDVAEMLEAGELLSS